ncbi:hypothetical protein Fcan01_09226 [Folsomia candida]|uniref:DUF4789 domain-containing protein n=1 Tax=Folsomia candida TaxID=158441 RepID=A0A226EEZ7_FOLCA|nr:hypothetical protein Fcan01_09226 [Folsomia candida]
MSCFIQALKFRRKKLCQKFGDLLYMDKTTGNWSCHGSRYAQGPCSEDMILFPLPTNRSVGVCQCDNIRSNRLLVYHKETDKCYFIFTRQTFCKDDEWVTLSSFDHYSAICTPNVCLNQVRTVKDPQPDSEWVPLNDGSCAILGMKHESCPPAGREDQVIRFFKHKIFPACSYHHDEERSKRYGRIFAAGVSVPRMICPEGFYETELGLCAVEFDDS